MILPGIADERDLPEPMSAEELLAGDPDRELREGTVTLMVVLDHFALAGTDLHEVRRRLGVPPRSTAG